MSYRGADPAVGPWRRTGGDTTARHRVALYPPNPNSQ